MPDPSNSQMCVTPRVTCLLPSCPLFIVRPSFFFFSLFFFPLRPQQESVFSPRELNSADSVAVICKSGRVSVAMAQPVICGAQAAKEC